MAASVPYHTEPAQFFGHTELSALFGYLPPSGSEKAPQRRSPALLAAIRGQGVAALASGVACRWQSP